MPISSFVNFSEYLKNKTWMFLAAGNYNRVFKSTDEEAVFKIPYAMDDYEDNFKKINSTDRFVRKWKKINQDLPVISLDASNKYKITILDYNTVCSKWPIIDSGTIYLYLKDDLLIAAFKNNDHSYKYNLMSLKCSNLIITEIKNIEEIMVEIKKTEAIISKEPIKSLEVIFSEIDALKVIIILKLRKPGKIIAAINHAKEDIANNKKVDGRLFKNTLEDKVFNELNNILTFEQLMEIYDRLKMPIMGTIIPYVQGKPANDEQIANKLLDIYRQTRNIIIDAMSPGNFLYNGDTGETTCVDFDMAYDRNSDLSRELVLENPIKFYEEYFIQHQDKFPHTYCIISNLLYLEKYIKLDELRDAFLSENFLIKIDAYRITNLPLRVDMLNDILSTMESLVMIIEDEDPTYSTLFISTPRNRNAFFYISPESDNLSPFNNLPTSEQSIGSFELPESDNLSSFNNLNADEQSIGSFELLEPY